MQNLIYLHVFLEKWKSTTVTPEVTLDTSVLMDKWKICLETNENFYTTSFFYIF